MGAAASCRVAWRAQTSSERPAAAKSHGSSVGDRNGEAPAAPTSGEAQPRRAGADAQQLSFSGSRCWMDEDRCSSSRRANHSSAGAVPPMGYSLLKKINQFSRNVSIRTRIARLWEHRMADNYLAGLHMVLVDEEGGTIHAFVRNKHTYLFQKRLEEGRVYDFQRLTASPLPSKGKRWPAYRSCELRFTAESTLTLIDPHPDGFLLYAYKLRSFQDIEGTVMDDTYLADVVGLVTGISDIVTFNDKSKRDVHLTDLRNNAIITLWGELASMLDADKLICQSKREPVILLAMGCTFKMLDSTLSLESYYGSTRICINPAILDVSALRERSIRIVHSIERINDTAQRLGVSAVQNTCVTNLVEGSSSGAGHTGSGVDAVPAVDPVAEHKVSAAQQHNTEPPTSVYPESLENVRGADDPQVEHGPGGGAEALEEVHTDGNNGQEEVEHGDGPGVGADSFNWGNTDEHNGQQVEHGNYDLGGDLGDSDAEMPRLLPTYENDQPTSSQRKKKNKWTDSETEALLSGVKIHGTSKWKQIRMSFPDVLMHRTPVDLKDKYRNLKRYQT